MSGFISKFFNDTSLKGVMLSAALGLGSVAGLVTPNSAEALSNRAQQSIQAQVNLRSGTLNDVQRSEAVDSGAFNKAAMFAPKLQVRGFEQTFLDNMANDLYAARSLAGHHYLSSGVRGVDVLEFNGSVRARRTLDNLIYRTEQMRDVQFMFQQYDREIDSAQVRYHNQWLRQVQQQARQSFRDNRGALESGHQMLSRQGQTSGRFMFHPINTNVLIYKQKNGEPAYLVADQRSRSVLNVTDPAAMQQIDDRSDQVIKSALRNDFSDPRGPEAPSRGYRGREFRPR